MVVLLLSEERIRMLFPALRWMSLASTVLPLTVMSSLPAIPFGLFSNLNFRLTEFLSRRWFGRFCSFRFFVPAVVG